MKILRTLLVASLFTATTSASAMTVDFDVFNGSSFFGSGSFTGNDMNSDNLLTFSELDVFSFVSTGYGHNVSLGDLVDTGDFDITNTNWFANGVSWSGNPDDAFFTWNNRNNSVNSTWATVITSAVPEPSTYALMFGGLGLVGLMAARRRKQA